MKHLLFILCCCILVLPQPGLTQESAPPDVPPVAAEETTPGATVESAGEQRDEAAAEAEMKKKIADQWQQTLMSHSQKEYTTFISEFKDEKRAANEIAKAQTLVDKLKQGQKTSPTGTGKKSSRFLDLGDGTIMDRQSGLMWTKFDSYADLGKCLSFPDSYNYVRNLQTGGYSDWQVPSVHDIQTIYDNYYFLSAFDRRPIHFPPVFQEGCAWWFWTRTESETGSPKVKDFVHGDVGKLDANYCDGGGVRAVRFTEPFVWTGQ